jgi:probable rRNA maturation factor
MAVRLAVSIVGVLPRDAPTARQLTRWARLAAQGLRSSHELSLRVVGLSAARRLNRRYRGRDYATNVLSFPPSPIPTSITAPRRPKLLGDLLLCAPVLKREARAQGKALPAHWAHMVVHGTLHLLGFQHERVSDARKMQRRERRLLQQLGFPNPYE